MGEITIGDVTLRLRPLIAQLVWIGIAVYFGSRWWRRRRARRAPGTARSA